MFKKLFQGALVGAAMLGLMGTAGAATLELNLYGASAQFKFWNAAIPTFLDTTMGCDTPTFTSTSTHGISKGLNCGGPGNTIIIRYSSLNSSYGIGAACGLAKYSNNNTSTPTDDCPAGQVRMCSDVGACSGAGLVCKEVHVGASDVEMTSFTQTVVKDSTFTYNDPTKTCPDNGNQSLEFLNANCPSILNGTAKSVVVPFGFAANNAVTKWRCTAPGPTGPNQEHYAYPHWGWQCDPTKNVNGDQNPDCIGYYKCFDSGSSSCTNSSLDETECGLVGGIWGNGKCWVTFYGTQPSCVQPVNGFCSDLFYTTQTACEGAIPPETWTVNTWTAWGKTCAGQSPTTAGVFGNGCATNGNLDCPNDISETKCEQMPIDNLSRLMVLQIFSSDNASWLDRWSQFGPWYPDAGIVRCMRCAGSGTHATFDMQVFRGDASLMGFSIPWRFFHHDSSDTLVGCINDNGWPAGSTPDWSEDPIYGPNRYAVGYTDVDKFLKSSTWPNVHIVKYQGVEPARAKIENNEYNFWAAQTLYWSTSEISAAGLTNLLDQLIAAAQNSAFLATINPQKLFWTTTGEMACQKTPNERYYPTVVPSSSPNYPTEY